MEMARGRTRQIYETLCEQIHLSNSCLKTQQDRKKTQLAPNSGKEAAQCEGEAAGMWFRSFKSEKRKPNLKLEKARLQTAAYLEKPVCEYQQNFKEKTASLNDYKF